MLHRTVWKSLDILKCCRLRGSPVGRWNGVVCSVRHCYIQRGGKEWNCRKSVWQLLNGPYVSIIMKTCCNRAIRVVSTPITKPRFFGVFLQLRRVPWSPDVRLQDLVIIYKAVRPIMLNKYTKLFYCVVRLHGFKYWYPQSHQLAIYHLHISCPLTWIW